VETDVEFYEDAEDAGLYEDEVDAGAYDDKDSDDQEEHPGGPPQLDEVELAHATAANDSNAGNREQQRDDAIVGFAVLALFAVAGVAQWRASRRERHLPASRWRRWRR
jgi:hypothetical protein